MLKNLENSGTEEIGLVTATPGLGTSYAIELMELLSTRKIVIAMI